MNDINKKMLAEATKKAVDEFGETIVKLDSDREELEDLLAPHIQEFKAGHMDKLIERLVTWHTAKLNEASLETELYYLEKLNKVYNDINTGVAKKQSNSTYYINKAIHTESEIKHIKARLQGGKES